MKIKKDGCIYTTNNQFVIEQMLKYGGVEVKEKPKPTQKKQK